jgi:hypothetical protein
MKKADLMKQCKEQGIKGYSKMKKDELISTLEESGIANTYVEVPKKEKKETVKNANSSPRLDKLSKKLERFSTLDLYKNELNKFDESVADEDLLDLVTESMKSFIISDSIEHADYKKYVNTYGPIKSLVEYNASPDSEDLVSSTEEQIYKTLATHIYYSDTEITSTLYKKIRKLIAANNKAAKKPSKKVNKYIEEVDEESDNEGDEVEEDEGNNVDDDVEDSEEDSEEDDE